MGCCGGRHNSFHDGRERRRKGDAEHHREHDASAMTPEPDARGPQAGGMPVKRWVGPLVFALGVALLYFVLR